MPALTILFHLKAYEVQGDPVSFYRALSAPRHCSFMGIRQAYKKVSLTLHPDKNTRPGASADFQRISDIYEVQCVTKSVANATTALILLSLLDIV